MRTYPLVVTKRLSKRFKRHHEKIMKIKRKPSINGSCSTTYDCLFICLKKNALSFKKGGYTEVMRSGPLQFRTTVQSMGWGLPWWPLGPQWGRWSKQGWKMLDGDMENVNPGLRNPVVWKWWVPPKDSHKLQTTTNMTPKSDLQKSSDAQVGFSPSQNSWDFSAHQSASL